MLESRRELRAILIGCPHRDAYYGGLVAGGHAGRLSCIFFLPFLDRQTNESKVEYLQRMSMARKLN